jgi:hypothetical protein
MKYITAAGPQHVACFIATARDFAIALFELIFKVLPPLKKNSLL